MHRFIIFLLFGCCLVLMCCKQSKSKSANTATDSLVNKLNSPSGNEYAEGARLLAANDCLTCHDVHKKMTGPSFEQIAAKYHNDQKFAVYLTNSVVHGSKGAWGEAAMTPHPQVHVSDITEMVKYILSVQGEGK